MEVCLHIFICLLHQLLELLDERLLSLAYKVQFKLNFEIILLVLPLVSGT
jgi:hypothetical protein